MTALPPILFLFLYPHLFHLGLSDWIKSHLKSPFEMSQEYTERIHFIFEDADKHRQTDIVEARPHRVASAE